MWPIPKSKPVEYSHTHGVELPHLEGLHAIIVACLTTSAYGPWHADPNVAPTAFHMLYRRGNWIDATTPGDFQTDLRGLIVARTQPMLLEVTLRPSRSGVSLSIHHRVVMRKKPDVAHVRDALTYWQGHVRKEVNELCAYIRDCFDLQEPIVPKRIP